MFDARTVACPFCGTTPGLPCRDRDGRFQNTIHHSRTVESVGGWITDPIDIYTQGMDRR